MPMVEQSQNPFSHWLTHMGDLIWDIMCTEQWPFALDTERYHYTEILCRIARNVRFCILVLTTGVSSCNLMYEQKFGHHISNFGSIKSPRGKRARGREILGKLEKETNSVLWHLFKNCQKTLYILNSWNVEGTIPFCMSNKIPHSD